MADHPRKDFKGSISNVADQATDMAHAQAEAATEVATKRAEESVNNYADAATAASREFEPGSFQEQAADQVAGHLTDVAELIKSTDFNQVAGKTAQFARENPLLFLGGAALAGFAAARYLKASEPAYSRKSDDSSDPWTGHVTGTPQRRPAHTPPVAPAQSYQNGRAQS